MYCSLHKLVDSSLEQGTTHPTAKKRMKVKSKPHRDTPQPMNVMTWRALSLSGLL
jgi:hypothetical protein